MSPEKFSTNQPKDPKFQAEQNKVAGGKSRSVRSSIGRSTRAAMHMRENRYICKIEQNRANTST